MPNANKASLVSAYVLLGEAPSFLLPVFRRGKDYLVQRVSDRDLILGFERVEFDPEDELEIWPLAKDQHRALKIGDAAVALFGFSKSEIFLGTRSELAQVMKANLARLTGTPNILLEVVSFITDADPSYLNKGRRALEPTNATPLFQRMRKWGQRQARDNPTSYDPIHEITI